MINFIVREWTKNRHFVEIIYNCRENLAKKAEVLSCAEHLTILTWVEDKAKTCCEVCIREHGKACGERTHDKGSSRQLLMLSQFTCLYLVKVPYVISIISRITREPIEIGDAGVVRGTGILCVLLTLAAVWCCDFKFEFHNSCRCKADEALLIFFNDNT